MKKVLSLLLCLVVVLSTLSVISCSSKHPIEEMKEKITESGKNAQIQITMSNVPVLGTVTTTKQFDNNIRYEPAFLVYGEAYYETVGDVEYKYTKDADGKWTKEETEPSDEDGILSLLNPESYEEVSGEENTYKQKSDVTFEEYENVTLKIDDNSCTINAQVTSDGVVCDVKIVISKIGEIDLTLPEVG